MKVLLRRGRRVVIASRMESNLTGHPGARRGLRASQGTTSCCASAAKRQGARTRTWYHRRRVACRLWRGARGHPARWGLTAKRYPAATCHTAPMERPAVSPLPKVVACISLEVHHTGNSVADPVLKGLARNIHFVAAMAFWCLPPDYRQVAQVAFAFSLHVLAGGRILLFSGAASPSRPNGLRHFLVTRGSKRPVRTGISSSSAASPPRFRRLKIRCCRDGDGPSSMRSSHRFYIVVMARRSSPSDTGVGRRIWLVVIGVHARSRRRSPSARLRRRQPLQ